MDSKDTCFNLYIMEFQPFSGAGTMVDEGQSRKTIVGQKVVVFFTFFLIIFTTAVQIFLIQAEIGAFIICHQTYFALK